VTYNSRSSLTSPVSLGESTRNNTKLTRPTSLSNRSKSKHVSFADKENSSRSDSSNNSLDSESECDNSLDKSPDFSVGLNRVDYNDNIVDNCVLLTRGRSLEFSHVFFHVFFILCFY